VNKCAYTAWTCSKDHSEELCVHWGSLVKESMKCLGPGEKGTDQSYEDRH